MVRRCCRILARRERQVIPSSRSGSVESILQWTVITLHYWPCEVSCTPVIFLAMLLLPFDFVPKKPKAGAVSLGAQPFNQLSFKTLALFPFPTWNLVLFPFPSWRTVQCLGSFSSVLFKLIGRAVHGLFGLSVCTITILISRHGWSMPGPVCPGHWAQLFALKDNLAKDLF